MPKPTPSYIGRQVYGKTAAGAMSRARAAYKIPKTLKIHLEFQYRDPPYNIYEIQLARKQKIKKNTKGRGP